MQTHLREPSKIHPQAKQFAKYYEKYGFEHTMKLFGFMGWRFQLKLLKTKLVRMIKKLYEDRIE